MLSSLSQLELCIKPRANSTELVSPATTHPNWKQNKRESVSTSTNNSSSVTHLHVQVPLRVSLSTANGPVQNHSLFTTLRAGQLHLKGWLCITSMHFSTTKKICMTKTLYFNRWSECKCDSSVYIWSHLPNLHCYKCPNTTPTSKPVSSQIFTLP